MDSCFIALSLYRFIALSLYRFPQSSPFPLPFSMADLPAPLTLQRRIKRYRRLTLLAILSFLAALTTTGLFQDQLGNPLRGLIIIILGMISFILGIVFFILWIITIRSYYLALQRYQKLNWAICIRCGFVLPQMIDPCPECGDRTRPADRERWWARFLHRAPRIPIQPPQV
jgi:hypothetical protein